MERLRKSYYLILMTLMGIVYLSTVDKWQIYAQAMEQVKNFCAGGREQHQPGRPAPGQQDSEGTGAGQENSGGEGPASEQQNPGGAGAAADQQNPDGQGAAPGQQEPDGEGIEDGELPENVGNGAPADGEQGADNTGAAGDGLPGEVSGEQSPEGMITEPVFGTVEDDYFFDAVFIGDSRTVGMYEYGGLEETAAFYASTGLTIYKLFDSAIVEVPGQKKKITIEEALQENSFAKIYLMIGINEMGTGTVETFIAKYREVVEHLKELQPEAIIYVQGIIRVTTERSNQGDYINNEGIEARNRELETLADGRSVFYLDVNPLICDETGGLIESYTFDGVHLKAKYIQIWKDYLKENAVLTDQLP